MNTPYISTYTKTVYRIKRRNTDDTVGFYDGNSSIGMFEFLTENNARKYIKEKKLNATVEKVKITTKEEIELLSTTHPLKGVGFHLN